MRETIPVRAQACLHDKIFRDGPGVLRVCANLGVGEIGICGAGKSRLPDEGAIGAQSLDFAALGEKRIGKARHVEADRELMCAMPVAGGGDYVGDGLEAAAAAVRALEIVSRGAVDE